MARVSFQILDARRLLCPLPVIRTQEKVKQLATDDTLQVVCTDPGVLQDIPTWCRINGHQVLNILSESDEYRITLKVGEQP